MIFLESDGLHHLMVGVLRDKGVNEDSTLHVVRSLVQTSLRGVDSHGINLFPHYCRAVDGGRISKDPQISIEQTASSTAIIDADHALGHHAGAVAMEYATELAKKTGVSAICVKNSTHFGAAAYMALLAAEQDCLGFAFTNADALVKAFGSTDAFCGTNPICFTAPLEKEEPLCLDMATSLVSWNRIANYRRSGNVIPDHWAFGKDGKSVTDPEEARSLSPIGAYKGFGLGIMIDVLCGVLSKGPVSKDLLAMYSSPIESKRKIAHFFMAIDIGNFIEISEFKRKLQSMVDRIRELPVLPGVHKVMVPGDPEKNTFQRRIEEGIPVDEVIFAELVTISADFQQVVK